MDWCGFFQSLTQEYADATSADPWRVFSDADPTRVWNGERTIEFARRGSATTPYISGDYSQATQLSVFTRCQTELEAEAAARAVFARVVGVALDVLLKTEKISGYKIDRLGVFADERGASVGESFSGFADFTIYEEVSIDG